MGHGQYAWKQYIVLLIQPGVYAALIRNVHADLLAFQRYNHLTPEATGGDSPDSPELLWRNLVQSNIARVFWKDRERRFLGASHGFLQYYGFSGVEEIVGRTDEDLGWHIHPDSYMNDELRVIHEGITTHNIPGHCFNNGENREILASKAPLYDNNGEVRGLIGCFIDRDLLTVNDRRGKETKRRDMLTGLLNSRGISEEVHSFEDEYNLRNVDFVRLHVAIDDFPALNRQYGYDFGDRIISTLGRALKKALGHTCAVGRNTGHQFVVLHQIHESGEAGRLRGRIKQIAADIQQVDGIALTLYLSVGYCVYSECEDADEQTQKAEIRLLADHDDHSSVERRMTHASEIFHLYDDLPIPYCVCKVLTDGDRSVYDAMLFYANHAFERLCGLTASQLLGRRVSQLFGPIDDAWRDMARRAAFNGESIVDILRFSSDSRNCHITASPIIHNGYCCFTYQPSDILG